MKPDPQLVADLFARCKAELDRLWYVEEKLLCWSPEKWTTQGKAILESRTKILGIMERLAQGDIDGAKTAWERLNE